MVIIDVIPEARKMFRFLYRNADSDGSFQRNVKTVFTSYLIALQPWSFSVSLAPVALGNVLSWREKSQFSLPIFLFSTIVVLSVHAASNAVHAYRDGHGKTDQERSGKADKERAKAMVQIGAVLYVLACVAMFVVTCISPAKTEHLALLFFGGLSASFLYTGSQTFCFNPS